MAFMVLTKEQIALLTEEQKKQYEDELDMYNERVAFVEHIKILEDVKIPPYEPEFQYITVIDEIPEKDFDNLEYKIKACNSISKIELNEISFLGVQPICMVLPEHLGKANIQVDHIEKVKATPSELPKVIKLKLAVQSFEQIESKPPIIPSVVKMEMEPSIVFRKTFSDISVEPTNMLNIDVPDVSSISFTAPEVEKFIFPEVTIAFDNIKEFDKIEQTELKLPNMMKSNVDMKIEKTIDSMFCELSLCQIKPIQATLPELSHIEDVDFVFAKIQLSNIDLPTILKPTVVDYKKTKTFVKQSMDDLPMFSLFKPEIKPFKKQEYKKAELPVIEIINDLKPEIKPFKKQEYKKVKLPVIERVNVVDKMFKSVERPKVQSMIVPASIVPIKAFTKTESKIKGLPNKMIINIPNAYEKMTELLYEK